MKIIPIIIKTQQYESKYVYIFYVYDINNVGI